MNPETHRPSPYTRPQGAQERPSGPPYSPQQPNNDPYYSQYGWDQTQIMQPRTGGPVPPQYNPSGDCLAVPGGSGLRKPKKHTGRNVLIGVVAGVFALCGISAIAVATDDNSQTTKPGITKATATSVAAVPTQAAAPQQDQQEDQSGPKGFKVGEVASFTSSDGSAGTITVLSVKVARNKLTGDYDFIAKVTMTCTAGSVDYNPWDWKFVDGSGQTHTMDIISDGMDDGTLAKGQNIVGSIAFQGGSSKLLHGARVNYASNIFLGTEAYWTVP